MPGADWLEIARAAASPLERARLGLSADAEIYRERRIRHHNDAAFLVEDAALPVEVFAGLDERGHIADSITALAQEYGLLLGTAQERVSAADNRRPVEWRFAHSNLPGGYYLAELR